MFKKAHTLTVMVSLGGLSWAAGASIGINFGSGRADAALDPATLAGVVPQANWNNAPGASGNLAVLNGADGSASGAAVVWATDEQWSAGTGPGSGDATLLNGWISANNNNAPDATVSFTGIPYALYDLYIYTNHDRDTEDVDITGPFGTFRLHETDDDLETGLGNPVTWMEQTATADGDPTQQGNYVRFQNLSGSSLDLILAPAGAEGSTDRGAITGMQLVLVPEPSSVVLLSLAGLFAGFRRRR